MIASTKTERDELHNAIDRLRSTARGRTAMKALAGLIDAGLDGQSQDAVVTLLTEAWIHGRTGTVLQLCREST